MLKRLFQYVVSIKRSFIAHSWRKRQLKNSIKDIVANYQDFSFLDAESLDSGMSLTNATDVRHTDPEFKVFYRISQNVESSYRSVAIDSYNRSQQNANNSIQMTYSTDICGLSVIGCWAVSFQLNDQSKDRFLQGYVITLISFQFQSKNSSVGRIQRSKNDT